LLNNKFATDSQIRLNAGKKNIPQILSFANFFESPKAM